MAEGGGEIPFVPGVDYEDITDDVALLLPHTTITYLQYHPGPVPEGIKLTFLNLQARKEVIQMEEVGGKTVILEEKIKKTEQKEKVIGEKIETLNDLKNLVKMCK